MFFHKQSWNAVILKVLKGNFAPVNKIYSRELRNLVEKMLSVNTNSRPSIAAILEKSFIKQRVANYIIECWREFNDGGKTDLTEAKMNVLKEQALKLGVFNIVLHEISVTNYSPGKGDEAEFLHFFQRKKKEREELVDFIDGLEKEKDKIMEILNTVSGKGFDRKQFRPYSGEKSGIDHQDANSRSKSKQKNLRPISSHSISKRGKQMVCYLIKRRPTTPSGETETSVDSS